MKELEYKARHSHMTYHFITSRKGQLRNGKWHGEATYTSQVWDIFFFCKNMLYCNFNAYNNSLFVVL